QCRSRALDEWAVVVTAAFEVKDARGEKAITPGGRDVEIVFEHGRAEFVVVRVAAFREDQRASAVDEVMRLGIGAGIGERLLSGLALVVLDSVEDAVERGGPVGRQLRRLKLFDLLSANVSPALHRAAEERQEGSILQQQELS